MTTPHGKTALAMFVGAMTAFSFGASSPDTIVAAPADVSGPPVGATTTASGLAYRVLKTKHGADRATARGHVLVRYTGWTVDGKMFDSSHRLGEPVGFDVEDVVPGWAEGLQLMAVGDTFRFWMPGPLAFDGLKRPIAPRGMLVFDVELLALQ